MKRKKIVIFEQNEGVRFVIERALLVFNRKLDIFSSDRVDKIYQILEEDNIDLFITEISNRDSIGANLSTCARNLHPSLRIVWLSILGCNHLVSLKRKLGNIICIDKPLEITTFRKKIMQQLDFVI